MIPKETFFSQFRSGVLSGLSFILLAGILGCYTLANVFSSALLSYKHGFRYFFMLPIVFATLHFSYGLGSIRGLLTVRKWIVKNTLATKARRHKGGQIGQGFTAKARRTRRKT